ncbi:hypothetical protein J2X65_002991 [Ancylobacter sp. 3268]|uniref:hypothetical protein n=1 Tax=Ancylobacter sp. 3268 TaxID=2817752 RepID=UPI002857AFD5|nr:hypothetical protein [Ancylobacter sp. 3268]MDR6953628.1 hypothetical protein [Ancylobacter sp. 3268]
MAIEFDVEHPEALAVAVATRQAIDAGLLPEGAGGRLDMARSRRQAIALMGVLQQRLELVLPPFTLQGLPSFFVLMIESRTWGYFTPTLRGFDTSARPSRPRLKGDDDGGRDCLLLMSQAAGAAIAKGQISFAQATGHGMVLVDAPAIPATLVEAAFDKAYPAGGFSTFVCTEVV